MGWIIDLAASIIIFVCSILLWAYNFLSYCIDEVRTLNRDCNDKYFMKKMKLHDMKMFNAYMSWAEKYRKDNNI